MPLLSEKLSQFWLTIQERLFPWLQEELGELSEKQRQLVSILEMTKFERLIATSQGWPGRPEKDRCTIARAFVAKVVYNMSTTRQLLERLGSDTTLRRLCGWESQKALPSESTFSRAFAEFAKSKLAEQAHAALIEKYESPRLVGHISRDSTQIETRQQPVKKVKKKELPKKKRGRPKKGEVRIKDETRLERQQKMTLEEMINDLPTACDSGTKLNSKGYPRHWFGHKFHVDTGDGEVPITCFLTSASVHDSQVALPLAIMTAKKVDSCYDVMDSAYDTGIIREHCKALGHIPIIDFNNRTAVEKREFAPHEAQRYKERTTVERVFARLKDEFGGRMIRVRGAEKVMASLMFGILALTADQLLRLVR